MVSGRKSSHILLLQLQLRLQLRLRLRLRLRFPVPACGSRLRFPLRFRLAVPACGSGSGFRFRFAVPAAVGSAQPAVGFFGALTISSETTIPSPARPATIGNTLMYEPKMSFIWPASSEPMMAPAPYAVNMAP